MKKVILGFPGKKGAHFGRLTNALEKDSKRSEIKHREEEEEEEANEREREREEEEERVFPRACFLFSLLSRALLLIHTQHTHTFRLLRGRADYREKREREN